MLHLGFPGVVSGWRRILEGDGDGDEADVELSSGLQRLASDVQNGGPTDAALRDLASDRERCERELRELSAMLDNESRECERMRVSLGRVSHRLESSYMCRQICSLIHPVALWPADGPSSIKHRLQPQLARSRCRLGPQRRLPMELNPSRRGSTGRGLRRPSANRA